MPRLRLRVGFLMNFGDISGCGKGIWMVVILICLRLFPLFEFQDISRIFRVLALLGRVACLGSRFLCIICIGTCIYAGIRVTMWGEFSSKKKTHRQRLNNQEAKKMTIYKMVDRRCYFCIIASQLLSTSPFPP